MRGAQLQGRLPGTRVAMAARIMPLLTESAAARLRAWLLPGGEGAARDVRGVRMHERGEIRSGPAARWMPFEAEEYVDATRSGFRWEARMGSNLLLSVRATDAYEDGHGSLVVKKGPIRLVTVEGPDADKGELQRYLAYVSLCPAMLLNHRSLAIEEVAPDTLRVHDHDRTETSVDVHVDEHGAPLVTRAIRPMLVGTKSVLTPWFATGAVAEEHDGMRIWRTMEASWRPPAGAFAYVRVEVTSFEVVR